MYQKEIIYMGLYKDGSRLGNAGFLRVEKRDQDGSLSLQVKNIPHSIKGKFPVRYYSGDMWKEVDGVTLQEGSGKWEGSDQDSLGQVRLQIMLPGGYLVEGMSKSLQEKPTPVKSEPEAEHAIEVMPVEAAVSKDEAEKNHTAEVTPAEAAVSKNEAGKDPAVEVTPAEEAASKGEPEADHAAEVTRTEVAVASKELEATVVNRGPETTAGVSAEKKRIEHIPVQKQPVRKGVQQPLLMADMIAVEGLKEDKWEQILDTYDRIHPYGDERVYVKLEPKDFIILSAKYQHLVNNSFLLHGFYNYRHVILGKEGDYYLGVPGVFYEREKMVALMFGFEAFECEGGEPRTGEFGYYLRKVEL